jgi:preprotein translocase subunit SecG
MVGFLIGFLTVVLTLVSLLLVFIVLMQKPKQEGLGAAFGGGVTDQMWGADATNILQKITVWLAVMFFVLTMTLAVFVGVKQKATINKEQLTTLSANPLGEGTSASVGLPPTAPPPESTNPVTTEPIKIPSAPKAEDTAPPKTEDAAPPKTEDAAPPKTEDTAPPKTEDATPVTPTP